MVSLENEALIVDVLPDCGGKICSLTSKASGRQWLWENPFLAVQAPEYGTSYIEQQDSGGWDEIFPSVSPCAVSLADGSTMQIPDHGDLVALPCEWEQPDLHTLILRTEGRCSPFKFVRTLRLDGPTLRISYRLENTGKVAFPYLWCAHPLFALESGMQIELPEGTPFQVRYSSDEERVDPAAPLLWSSQLSCVPDPAAPDFRPLAVKAFSEPGTVSSVRLTTASSDHLTLAWDGEACSYLGLWINYSAWSGCGSAPYFNLGVEPATAPYDGLDEAVENATERVIEPSEIVCWELSATYGNGKERR